jgi:hypothetical protein
MAKGTRKSDEPEPAGGQEFADIVAKIRPLPDNVVPSERFRAQMRKRLLDLEARSKPEAA